MEEVLVQLQHFQSTMEQRFGCCVCLGAKLHMVSGQCQHRICDDCLYMNDDRRPCMRKCPLCGMDNSFPLSKPIIPVQIIEMQRYLGVLVCPNGCGAEMWYWEADDHTKHCPSVCKSPAKQSEEKKPSRRSHVSDRGNVTTLSRTSTSSNKRVTRSVSQNQRVLRQRHDPY